MATNFPTSLDALTNPTGASSLTSPDHAAQHADANDAIEALQAKVGKDGSLVTTSHDYKLSTGTFSTLNVDSGTLVVDSTNNRVGVKTTSPSYELHVVGDALVSNNLFVQGGATFDAGTLRVDNTNNRVGVNTTNPQAALDVQATTGTAMRITNTGTGTSFLVEDSTSTDSTPFVIDSAGFVGIGTSSPLDMLHVQVPSGPVNAMRITNSGTGYSLLVEDSATTDSTPFIIDASGNVGVGKTPITLLDVNGTARALDYNIGASTKSMPRGIVAYNSTTTPDSTITTEEIQITGSSFTAVAGRYYRITYFEPYMSSSASCIFTMRIRQTNIAGTVLQTANVGNTFGNIFFGVGGICQVVSTFSAGTVNVVATLASSAGTGQTGRNSTTVASLLVEDIGTL